MNDDEAVLSKDPRWQSIFDNVPSDFLFKLAKAQRHYKLENLTKGMEVLVDEIFRVCDETTIQTLFEQFLGSEGPVWFYAQETDEASIKTNIKKHVDDKLRAGIQDPDVSKIPTLYKVEDRSESVIFSFAARDSSQNIRTGVGKKTRVEVVNEYRAVLHFSSPKLLIFGPQTFERANAVAERLWDTLEISSDFTCLKPGRGKGRDLYHSLKARLKAYLIETKRLDPSGDYATVALEARDRQPDLEEVPNFRKHYFDADSIYDVLQFRCNNPVGIQETTHVKIGRPSGRFAFAARTSLAAIYHFEKALYALLS